MNRDDLAYLELTDLTARLHARTLSPVEVTEVMLDRIRALDPALHSYALVLADSAMAEARAAEAAIARGAVLGPLHGAPIAVKDLCWMADVPTAAGTIIHQDFRPRDDATVVRRLRESGAIILGKLQLTEGAYADHHPEVIPPVNPWGAAYWPGASSSGSGVATAAGLCYGSLGSDTGGSIRFPSTAQGLTGLKPTWGRVSRHGVFELAATLDHIGPMARSARDAAAMLGVLAGPDERDPTAFQGDVPDYLAQIDSGIAGLRVGIDRGWVERAADAATRHVLAEAERVLGELGAEIVDVVFPDVRQAVADWFPLCGVEVAVAHEATYPARKEQYGPALSGLIELGRGLSGMDYQRIVLRRENLRGRVNALFGTIDLLLLPAQGRAAPTLAETAELGEGTSLLDSLLTFTCPFDLTGHPTLTLPGGFTGDGMPVAFQLAAAHRAEGLLCRAGCAFQSTTDHHRRHPALPA